MPVFQSMLQLSSLTINWLSRSIDVDALDCPATDHPSLVEQSTQLNEASCFQELRDHCVDDENHRSAVLIPYLG